jgi:hypothetical protein
MKRSLVTSGLVGAFALAFSAATALAHAGNLGDSEQQALSAATSPLVLVRAGGGGRGGAFGGFSHGFSGSHGGGFGGDHGFHGQRHFRGGFSTFGGSYYDDDYGDAGCWWSARYHRRVCY